MTNSYRYNPQERWDYHLTHKGRERALLSLGRALGFKFKQWAELPVGLQEQLMILWNDWEALR